MICKHQSHVIIDNIWEPKWSTKEVLINVNFIKPKVEHYLIKFSKTPSMPGWYYLNLKQLLKAKRQPNGRGEMAVIKLSDLIEFKPIERCEH